MLSELKYKIKAKEQDLKELKGEIENLKNQLRSICNHLETRKEKEYTEDSKTNQAYFEYYLMCNVCDSILDQKRHYLGFDITK